MRWFASIVRAVRSPRLQATLERLVSRGASAVVGLAIAFFVSPQDAGVYALGYIALSFVQSVGETTIRQVGVRLLTETGGLHAVRRLSWIVAWAGLLAMTLFTLALFLAGAASGTQAIALLPLALCAFTEGVTAQFLVANQYLGRWTRISTAQTLGSAASLAVALPLTPLLGILAGTLQTLVTDIIFLFALPKTSVPPRGTTAVAALGTDFAHTSGTNLFGWTQAQAERVTIAVAGGTYILGIYSFALQVSRALTDALATGIVNVFRSDLAHARSQENAAILESTSIRAANLALLAQAGTAAAAVFGLGYILPPVWLPAINITPLIGASSVAITTMWCASTYLIVERRARALIPWQIIGVVFSVAMGASMVTSLYVGIIVGIVRDVVGMYGRLSTLRRELSRSFFLHVTVRTVIAISFGVAMTIASISIHGNIG